MKVFIAWSGEPSKSIAKAFHHWLPRINQKLEPFLSSQDIEMGSRWEEELAKNLGEINCGILCLTPANKDSQWVLYEAGALSKNSAIARVCPVVFAGLTKADIEPPLGQRQIAEFTKEEMGKLLNDLNANLGQELLPQGLLSDSFDEHWDSLRKAVEEAEQAVAATAPVHRGDRELLEEILGYVRPSEPSGHSLFETISQLYQIGKAVGFMSQLAVFLMDVADNPSPDDGPRLRRIAHELAAVARELETEYTPAIPPTRAATTAT